MSFDTSSKKTQSRQMGAVAAMKIAHVDERHHGAIWMTRDLSSDSRKEDESCNMIRRLKGVAFTGLIRRSACLCCILHGFDGLAQLLAALLLLGQLL